MVNVGQTISFLQLLEPNHETHQFYWVGIHPDKSKKRRMAVGTLETVLPNLQQANRDGYGIYVCVNAIDTPSFEGGYPRRRKEDISRIRAVFADWDTPNKAPPQPSLMPSMIVNTSEGKYHMYWLVRDMALEDFEPVQRSIVASMGSDGSAIDLSRVLRVPGFLHTKDPAKLTPVELQWDKGVVYTSDTIKETFPPMAHAPKFSTWDGTIERKAALTHAVLGAMYLPRPDGGYNITCPWVHEHTMEGGSSESTYWPPSEKNDGRGSYVCQHAHCRGIRMVDELDAWVAERVKRSFA